MDDDTLCCWWCTFPFDNTPHTMPLRDDACTGHFCSAECTAAHMFETMRNPLTTYALLCRQAKHPVKLAAPRCTLRRFGGAFTIEAYRKKSNDYGRDVKVYNAPVLPAPGQVYLKPIAVEQVARINYKKNKYMPVNDERIERAANDLVLQRKKKLNATDGNTLEMFMKLKKTKVAA